MTNARTYAIDPGSENKEEKAEVSGRLTNAEIDALNNRFLRSHHFSLQAFCTAISPTGNAGMPASFLILAKIPSEIFLNHVFSFLVSDSVLKNQTAFTHTVQSLSPFFRGQLLNIRLRQLLQHIAYGEKDQAEAIIKTDSRLLLLSGPIVTDYAGRRIQQTAYQMAIAMNDVFVKFKNAYFQQNATGEAMKEMIERYMILLLGDKKGAIELRSQFNRVHPDNYAELLTQARANDYAALMAMFKTIAAVTAGNSDDLALKCEAALNTLKNYVERNEIITTTTPGDHFDPRILVEAYNFYEDNYDKFGGHGSIKNAYVWQVVLGLIERNLTACDAMILSQGPYSIVMDGNDFKRSLTIRDSANVYFPMATDSVWPYSDIRADIPMLHNSAASAELPDEIPMSWGFSVLILNKKSIAAKGYRSPIASNDEPVRHTMQNR